VRDKAPPCLLESRRGRELRGRARVKHTVSSVRPERGARTSARSSSGDVARPRKQATIAPKSVAPWCVPGRQGHPESGHGARRERHVRRGGSGGAQVKSADLGQGRPRTAVRSADWGRQKRPRGAMRRASRSSGSPEQEGDMIAARGLECQGVYVDDGASPTTLSSRGGACRPNGGKLETRSVVGRGGGRPCSRFLTMTPRGGPAANHPASVGREPRPSSDNLPPPEMRRPWP